MTKKEKFRLIGHILAGIIILIHAFERYEKSESATLHLVAGIIFLLVASFHHPLSKKVKWIDGLFYFLEGVVMFYTSYEFFHHEKNALAFTYLSSGVGFMIGSILISRKKIRQPAHQH